MAAAATSVALALSVPAATASPAEPMLAGSLQVQTTMKRTIRITPPAGTVFTRTWTFTPSCGTCNPGQVQLDRTRYSGLEVTTYILSPRYKMGHWNFVGTFSGTSDCLDFSTDPPTVVQAAAYVDTEQLSLRVLSVDGSNNVTGFAGSLHISLRNSPDTIAECQHKPATAHAIFVYPVPAVAQPSRAKVAESPGGA